MQSPIHKISMMEMQEQLQLASDIFMTVGSQEGVAIPPDFLEKSILAIKQLKRSKRTNFLYTLCKGLGTLRPDESDSLFPTKQVVSGLFEYCANFFAARYVDQVSK